MTEQGGAAKAEPDNLNIPVSPVASTMISQARQAFTEALYQGLLKRVAAKGLKEVGPEDVMAVTTSILRAPRVGAGLYLWIMRWIGRAAGTIGLGVLSTVFGVAALGDANLPSDAYLVGYISLGVAFTFELTGFVGGRLLAGPPSQ